MTLNKHLSIRMDKQLEAVAKSAALRAGMTLHEFIRHTLRLGLAPKRESVKLYLVP